MLSNPLCSCLFLFITTFRIANGIGLMKMVLQVQQTVCKQHWAHMVVSFIRTCVLKAKRFACIWIDWNRVLKVFVTVVDWTCVSYLVADPKWIKEENYREIYFVYIIFVYPWQCMHGNVTAHISYHWRSMHFKVFDAKAFYIPKLAIEM